MTVATDEMVTIAGIPTFVRWFGRGPVVVVVHGGPGFSHRYLGLSVDSLAERRTLVFYDQPGSGRSPVSGEVTADLIFRHFAALVDKFLGSGRLGILTHSWGSLVVLGGATTAGMRRGAFDEGLLVTPVPVTRAGYDETSRNLFARLPEAVGERYAQLATRGASREIVDLLLPYYFASPRPLPVAVDLDIGTFTSVTASLGQFDFTPKLALLDGCAVVTTDGDLSTPDLLDSLLSVTARRYHLSGVGHFPMYESPDDFYEILGEVFPVDGGAHSAA